MYELEDVLDALGESFSVVCGFDLDLTIRGPY